MEFSIRDDHSSKGAVTNTPLAANPNLLGQKQPRQFPGTRFLFGIAPGGACHTQSVTSLAVGSYSTFSPLPTLRQAVFFSVALSVELPRPGVTRHLYFLESGLSLSAGLTLQSGHPPLRAPSDIRDALGARQ